MAKSIWNRRMRHTAYRRIINRDLIRVCFHPNLNSAHVVVDPGLASILDGPIAKAINWVVHNFTERGAFHGRIFWFFKDTQPSSLERECFHLICKKIRNVLDQKTDYLPDASMELAAFLGI